ncbi:MAG: DUF3419 family protein [Hymenobacteraceae bacterium]|nr:DUF3419 family protein [Hymenobacteraceae bacterium]
MQSEFARIPLNRIRYSLVWEDCRTLVGALQPGPADAVLVITSAGTNVLATLLRQPRRVVAVDLNPLQNALLELQCHVVRHYSPEELRGLLGLDGPVAVARAWATVGPTLSEEAHAHWAAFFQEHAHGVLPAGQLEAYIGDYRRAAPATERAHLAALLACPTVADQAAYFERHLHGADFEARFTQWFADENLSQGRDPRLFRYAAEPGGPVFYQRLARRLRSRRLADDFYSRFFFFGPTDLPETLLPPPLQRRSFGDLRAALPALSIHIGEAVEYLLSPAGADITCASLSNIFEYVDPVDFEKCAQELAECRAVPLRFVYWNLLQDQQLVTATSGDGSPRSAALSAADGCFYFRNVHLYETCAGQIAAC